MAKPKILVLGRGYLAGRFQEYFQTAGYHCKGNPVDITDLPALETALLRETPTIVINAAGKTDTGAVEQRENQDEAYRVNVQGVANLAHLAPGYHYRLLHLSTGMMYDGVRPDGQPWTEADTPQPGCYYAWTKAWGDYQLAPFLEHYGALILRLHLPISRYAHPRNLIDKLRGFNKVCTAKSSLTVVEDLLAAARYLLEQKAAGIYNIVNSGALSLEEIAAMMRQQGLIAADKEVGTMTREELDAITAAGGKAKQSFPILSNAKLEAAGFSMPIAREAVEECLANYVAEA